MIETNTPALFLRDLAERSRNWLTVAEWGVSMRSLISSTRCCARQFAFATRVKISLGLLPRHPQNHPHSCGRTSAVAEMYDDATI